MFHSVALNLYDVTVDVVRLLETYARTPSSTSHSFLQKKTKCITCLALLKYCIDEIARRKPDLVFEISESICGRRK